VEELLAEGPVELDGYKDLSARYVLQVFPDMIGMPHEGRHFLAMEMLEGEVLSRTVEGRPLTIDNGAPLRLVAPAHYGYKNPKHLSGVEFWLDDRNYRPAAFRFMDHPRARVALESLCIVVRACRPSWRGYR